MGGRKSMLGKMLLQFKGLSLKKKDASLSPKGKLNRRYYDALLLCVRPSSSSTGLGAHEIYCSFSSFLLLYSVGALKTLAFMIL